MATQSTSSAPMDTDSAESIPTGSNENPGFQRVFETFSWDNVQSNLSGLHPLSSRTPPAADKNSAFLDLQKMPNDLDGRGIANALPETAIATKFRADTKFIQIFFEDEDEANDFINQKVLTVGRADIPILPPKGKLPPVVHIKLDNVPIRGRKFITQQINDIMAEFCLPKEIAPVTIKGTKLFTSRWEMLVESNSDKNLGDTLPSIINIDSQKVLLSWPGSPATCIQCLSVGHLRKNCPKRTKPAPETKQKTVPPKTKGALPKTTNTYAAAVTQTLSGRTTPENETTDANNDYQGHTGLYETTRPSTPTQYETPGSSQNTDIPTHDPTSPFNATAQSQKGLTYQIGSNNKKRALHISPTGSPKQISSTNLLPMMTDPLSQKQLTPSPNNQY